MAFARSSIAMGGPCDHADDPDLDRFAPMQMSDELGDFAEGRASTDVAMRHCAQLSTLPTPWGCSTVSRNLGTSTYDVSTREAPTGAAGATYQRRGRLPHRGVKARPER